MRFPLAIETAKRGAFAPYFKNVLSRIEEHLGGDPTPPIDKVCTSPALMEVAINGTLENARDFGMDPTSFSKFKLADFVGRHSGVVHYWHHYRWQRTGRYIYDLSMPLTEGFLSTDLNVPLEEIKLPQPTIYLSVPETELMVWHPATGEHVLDGFYVTEHRGSYPDTGKPYHYLYVVAVGRAHPNRPVGDNALSSYCIPLDEGYSIEEWFEEAVADEMTRVIMGDNADRVKDRLRIVLNALLYIEHVPEDVEADDDYGVPASKLKQAKKMKPAVRKRFLAKYRPNVRYLALGRKFKEPAVMDSITAPIDRKITKRFGVRGHWRDQACGPGRQDRKRIWINPHWKGPENGEVSSPITIVRVE